MLHGCLILALVLCAWEPGLRSRLLSLLGEAPTAMLPSQPTAHVNRTGPFNDLAIPTSLMVFFAHPWLKVSFSGSVQFISGDYSPL